MKRTLFFGILVTLAATSGPQQATDRTGASRDLTGPAVLDDWGNRFTSLGASAPRTRCARRSAPPSHSWRCSTP